MEEQQKKSTGYAPPGMHVGGILTPQIHGFERRQRGGGFSAPGKKTSIRDQVMKETHGRRPLREAAEKLGFEKVQGTWRRAS